MKKLIIIFAVLCLFGFLFIFYRQRGMFLSDEIQMPSITPVPKPSIPTESTSIDGIKKLTMKTLQKDKGMVSYTFLITDGDKQYSIFTTDAKADTFTVPSNSWSPDSMYVFLINTTSQPEQILVFNASGESFADGKQYLNVTELFAAKNSKYMLDTATGWDSRGLLHISTKNQDRTNGPSYWFAVGSRSFIELAAR